ncbi:tRNA (adenosine(37)-N6)-threonylcarbamoyltransferase complex dimerization subunit type 1 TsaB [uncultured Sphingomonas sp.]|uniref:tRNA (adenosine(37)-N6)-threonylcarbamoyltransferase complex dimerization subunit type 1 TsaB n=1 Tax=uncultured Sphingomonas sp. TaxID=158754 RepID=UPI0035CB52CA
MLTLIIETATAACSVALIERDHVVARLHEIVGRGHAERLVPMIAELPGGGRAARIMVDCGPGSFTGIRVGIAAARGLALGWGMPVTGYSSLALVAAAALAARPELRRVAAVLEGGHGEVFMQIFDATLLPLGDLASLTPQAAVVRLDGLPAFGSGAARLLAVDPVLDVTQTLPDAGDAWRLPPQLAALSPRPLYGRAPDAKIAPGIAET